MTKAVGQGKFRQDLYYRLATVPVVLPALRKRREDIPKIAVRYLNRTDARDDWELSGDAIELLTSKALTWPGNIRELESVLERARNRARGDDPADAVLEGRHLGLGGVPETLHPDTGAGADELALDDLGQRWRQLTEQQSSLDELEKQIVVDALRACKGIVAKTARVLAVPRTGLISRISTWGLDVDEFKDEQERS